jgi:hypothetical protein
MIRPMYPQLTGPFRTELWQELNNLDGPQLRDRTERTLTNLDLMLRNQRVSPPLAEGIERDLIAAYLYGQAVANWENSQTP